MTDQNAGFTPPQGEPKSSGFDPQQIMAGFKQASQDADPQAWFEVWIKALTKPAEETYQELIGSPGANLYTGIIWLVVGLVLQAFFAILASIVGFTLSPQYSFTGDGGIILALFCFPFVALVLLLLYLLITYAVHYFAMTQTKAILPETVTWQRLFYVFAAIFTPLTLIGAVLSILPIVGALLSSLTTLAGLGLMTIAVKGIYKLEWAQALMITGLLILLGICGLCGSLI